MKGRAVLLLEAEGWPFMAALVDDGRLIDLLIDPPEDDPTPRPGAIHWVKVTRPAPRLGGAFVDIGGGREGFLRGGGKAGATMLAQVSRHAEPGKAAPMTAEILMKGRYAILTPDAPGVNVARSIRDGEERARLARVVEARLADLGCETGAIVRSAAAEVDAGAIGDNVAELAETLAEARAASGAPHEAIAAPGAEIEAWRDWVDPDPDVVERGGAELFDRYGLWEEIEALKGPAAPLPAGAWMSIEPTRALVAVDVNTAGDMAPNAALSANIAALRELPRQLRLRGLGGQVVVDLAPLVKRDRAVIEQTAKAAFRADRIETTIAGWTPLGHLELIRKRERRPITELLPK
jgi:Ribonuclease G/E